MPEIQVVTQPITTLGESPQWDVNEERLYWIDVLGGTIFRSTTDGRELRVWRFPGHLTSLALRRSGGAIVTSGTGVHVLDLDSGDTDLVFDSGAGDEMSFNDGKVDRQGRLVTGLADRTLTDPASFDLVGSIEPAGSLYRIDGDLTAHHLTGGFGLTNGPCFSPDGTTLYCNDSWTRQVEAFDYDPITGAASNRRTVAWFQDGTAPGVSALPDGATVDAEGCIWVAAFYGHEIRRYAPDGTLDRRVPMPVASPTSVAFGGSDLDVLFVTSMGDAHLPGDVLAAGPLGGTILAVHGLGVTGVPETRFAG